MENLQNYLQLSDVVSEKVSVLHKHTYVRTYVCTYMPCTVCMYVYATTADNSN